MYLNICISNACGNIRDRLIRNRNGYVFLYVALVLLTENPDFQQMLNELYDNKDYGFQHEHIKEQGCRVDRQKVCYVDVNKTMKNKNTLIEREIEIS